MASGTSSELFSWVVAALLVLAPIVGGGLLLLAFEERTIHQLGLFLLGGGVIVGLALLLLRRE
jgi:ABC-type molybdate transport system permease subunit